MTFMHTRSRQQQLLKRQEICGSSGCIRGVELRSPEMDFLILLKRQKRPKHTRMMGIMGQTYPGWWFPRCMTYQFLHGIIAHLTILGSWHGFYQRLPYLRQAVVKKLCCIVTDPERSGQKDPLRHWWDGGRWS